MKVKDLITELSKHNPEAEVLNYVEELEDYGKTTKVVTILNQDDMPYAKGDTPKINGEIVLITGWLAS